MTLTVHCVIHHYVLAINTFPEELSTVMLRAIKLSYTLIWVRIMLLYYTEIHWFSKGNMLKQLYELKEDLRVFLNENINIY